jgi:Protein of unknown function (DUF4236)
MGLRFQRALSLLGGLARLNVSKSGLSLSLGPRGLSFNVGLMGKRRQRPNTLSIGLPGSGLSYRAEIGTVHHDPTPRQKLLPSMPPRTSPSLRPARRKSPLYWSAGWSPDERPSIKLTNTMR